MATPRLPTREAAEWLAVVDADAEQNNCLFDDANAEQAAAWRDAGFVPSQVEQALDAGHRTPGQARIARSRQRASQINSSAALGNCQHCGSPAIETTAGLKHESTTSAYCEPARPGSPNFEMNMTSRSVGEARPTDTKQAMLGCAHARAAATSARSEQVDRPIQGA